MGRKNRRKKIGSLRGKGTVSVRYLSPALYRSRIFRTPKRGDIWFADLGSHPGTSVQGGCRPVVVVSNDIGNGHSDTLNVLPVTKQMKKRELPCHTELDPAAITDVSQSFDFSMILAEQITTIGRPQLRNYAGRIGDAHVMDKINASISGQLGLEHMRGADGEDTNKEDMNGQ